VDDDDTFRIILREALNFYGYDVEEAANGQEAKVKLAQSLPDLVLLDIMMPGLNGVALCQQIRTNERTKTLPVVVISALGDSQAAIDAIKFGATDYVMKPFEMSELKAKLEKFFPTQ
jgi:two-component system phosphate regulon response regulator PhoB